MRKEQEEVPDEEEEQSKDPEKEQEEAEDEYSHIVNVHCDNNAKKALSESDLEFLADLLVNTLQPQAVNLLIDKFPALQKAVEIMEDDTPQTLQRRVMEQAEWIILPRAIDLIAAGRVTIEGRRTRIS